MRSGVGKQRQDEQEKQKSSRRSLPPVPTASPPQRFLVSTHPPRVRTHNEKCHVVQKRELVSFFPITNSWHRACLTSSFGAHRVSDTC